MDIPSRAQEWFNQGMEQYGQGIPEEALTCFEQALTLHPDYAEAWYYRGMILEWFGQRETALESLDRAVSLKPDFYEAWYQRGNVLHNLEQFELAMESYDRAIACEPTEGQNWNLWHSRSILLSRAAKLDEALADCDRALAILSQQIPDEQSALERLWSYRGHLLFQQGRFAEAILAFDQDPWLVDDFDQERIQALAALGRTNEAVGRYDRQLLQAPHNVTLWYQRGNTLFSLGRYEDAIASFSQALQIDPNDGLVQLSLEQTLEHLGRSSEIPNLYRTLLEHHPDNPKLWFRYAFALEGAEQSETAVASYDRAVELQPNNSGAWYNRGLILNKLGRFQEAITSFERAIAFDPEHSLSWHYRGDALLDLQQFEDAIASYNRAQTLTDFPEEQWQLSFKRGTALANLQQHREAIANYEQSIQILTALQRSEAERGYPSDLNFSAQLANLWYNHGLACFALQRYEAAIASFNYTLEMTSEDAEAYYEKARCYALLNQPEQAKQALEKAIALNPNYQNSIQTDFGDVFNA